MELKQIPKLSGLNRDSFKNEFLNPLKPVVFTDLISDWPAKDLWTFEYFISNYGQLDVPIVDKSFSSSGKSYMSPIGTMKFGTYLELISKEPTELRIFLFNIFKHAPKLINDIKIPTIMDGFYREFPFMFFGGQGSYTKIHYDIDCSHVFLTQFQKRKRVVLFAPDQSKYLYHLPFTVACLVDMIDPDIEKHPSLKYIKGYETILEHGETLFIPSRFWHHIEYTDGAFSLALRANNSIISTLNGVFNIAQHFAIDRGMNMVLGDKWMNIKKKIAYKNALV